MCMAGQPCTHHSTGEKLRRRKKALSRHTDLTSVPHSHTHSHTHMHTYIRRGTNPCSVGSSCALPGTLSKHPPSPSVSVRFACQVGSAAGSQHATEASTRQSNSQGQKGDPTGRAVACKHANAAVGGGMRIDTLLAPVLPPDQMWGKTNYGTTKFTQQNLHTEEDEWHVPC